MGTDASPTWEENPSPERIAEIIEATKGRGGIEDESCVSDCGWELADGYVSAYFGQGSRAARFLRRCGSKVLRIRVVATPDGTHHGVFVHVDKAAFRGLEYAFKNIDNKTPMTEEQKAALQALNDAGKDEPTLSSEPLTTEEVEVVEAELVLPKKRKTHRTIAPVRKK